MKTLLNKLKKTIALGTLMALPFLYSNNANAQKPALTDIQPHPDGKGWYADKDNFVCETGWVSGKCAGTPYNKYSNYNDIKYCASTPTKIQQDTTSLDEGKQIDSGGKPKQTPTLQTGQSIHDVYEYDYPIEKGEAKSKGAGWHGNDYLVDVELGKDKKIKIYPNTNDTADYAPDYSFSIDSEGKAKIQNFKPNVVYTLVKLDKETARLARTAQSPLGINVEKAVKKKIGNEVYYETETNFPNLLKMIEQSRIHYLDENSKENIDTFYVFYADTLKQLKENIETGQTLPLIFGKKVSGTDAFSYDREGNISFTGELYKAQLTSGNQSLVQDSLGNSLFYDSLYLTNNQSYLAKITKTDGTQGHALELSDAEVEKSKELKERKHNLRFKLSAGAGILNGYVWEINPQIKVGPNSYLGAYFSSAEFSKSLESIIQEQAPDPVLINLPAQMYWISTGSKITEKTNVSNNYGIGLNYTHILSPHWEASLSLGTIGQKTETTSQSQGEEYMEIAGVKDPTSVSKYNDITISETNKPLFNGSPAYAGLGIDYFPINKGFLKNTSISGQAGYIFGDSKETSMPVGSVKVNYTFNK